MKIKKSKLTSKENKWGYFFTAPWMLGFLAFFTYPLVYSLILSFGKVRDIVSYSLDFAGWTNYANAFFQDTDFIPLLLDTLKEVLIKTPLVVVFSLFIAILLNRELKFKGLFRVAFFLPVLLGTGVVMDTITGNIAKTASELAAEAYESMATSSEEMISLSGTLVAIFGYRIAYFMSNLLTLTKDIFWMSGIQIIIFLGALQTIPESYYEAAYCDGAMEWEKFWKITLPLVTPTILLNTVFTIIDFSTNAGNKVIKYTLDTTFKDFNLAYGSALGWIYFVISGVIAILAFIILRRFTNYD
ncbi:MAG TPA: hypothetical protein DDW86_08725 [Clostridiales bacterium]|nr:hypothetical protein [Clostridiales bacterium]